MEWAVEVRRGFCEQLSEVQIFYHADPGNQTQGLGLGSKSFDTELSHWFQHQTFFFFKPKLKPMQTARLQGYEGDM